MFDLKANKYMRSILLVIGFTILMLQSGLSQSSFHRTYPSQNGKDVLSISSIQMKDGNYVALELEVEVDENNNVFSDTFFVTSYKPKGDINWSKAFSLSGSVSGNIPALGSIIQGDNDSLYYSLIIESTENANKIIGSLANGGANGWMKSYTTIPDKPDGFPADIILSDYFNLEPTSHLLTNYHKSFFSGHVGGNLSEVDVAISRKDYNGNNMWSKLLAAKDENGVNLDENLTHLSFESDTSLLLAGIVDSLFPSSFITIADTLGNVKWSRKYADLQALVGFPFVYDVVKLPDSTYLLGGLSIELTASLAFSFKGFLIKTNKNGEVDWGKKVIFNDDDISVVKHLALDMDNNIIIAGINFDAVSEKAFNFVMKLKDDGSVLWKKKYPRVDATLDFAGNLFGTSDGGSAFITSVLEENLLRPSFIKLDNDGSSSCEENIAEDILFDNSYGADTLIWTTKDAGKDSVVTYVSVPHSYDVPVLSLDVKPFCPEEPIDWTFHAATKGATYYKWSTGLEGPDQDSLRVFEEGKYSVTVTIGEKVCYMLCDTSELTRYDKPQVQLGLSLGNFCVTNKQTLNAGYIPGHPQIKSAVWSTGETNVSLIDIDKPGTYKITVVDGCDEMATAEISVGEFPKKITSASISGQVAVDCFEGTASGILTASGNSSGLGVERYLWSSGQSTKAISINDTDRKTYAVTVTDGCGGTASASYNVEINGPGITKADIIVNKDGLCTNKSISLNAVADRVGRLQYIWSTSETTPNINVTTVGSYSVTVTDLCGNKASGTVDVKEEDLSPKDIEYAHVFFPDGVGFRFEGGDSRDTMAYESLFLNRTFGPVDLQEYCLNEISNYEFYVFNRWGQQVFESKDIRDEWDGRISEKESPADTYVWVAKYSIFGFEKTKKGDVTMIRK